MDDRTKLEARIQLEAEVERRALLREVSQKEREAKERPSVRAARVEERREVKRVG